MIFNKLFQYPMPNDMFKNNWEEARERDGKTVYHERIHTGERPLRQPPEIVWADQGEYLCQICKKLVSKSYREYITHLDKAHRHGVTI